MSQALFISKQPILDRQNSIHDFIFYYTPYEQMREGNHTKAFIDALFDTGLHDMAEGKRAFIKINHEMLLDASIFSFPNELLILGIDDTESIDETMIKRVNELKDLNFKFAIFHASDKEDLLTELEPLLSFIDYFVIDTAAIDIEAFKPLLKKLLQHPFTIIAANLRDDETKQAYSALGLDLFSGHYYLDTELDDDKEIDKGYQETLNLLNTLQNSESIDEIAAEFASYPHITLQLLRYLNSPVFSLQRTIKSIRHALLLIGRKDLRRWLLILAFTQTSDGTVSDSPLLYTANIRMALMRFLVERLEHSTKALADEAPFVAVLSLLQPLVGVSFEKLFETISIDKEIKDAIISYEGTLGKLLELTIATEQMDSDRVAQLLDELGLEPETFEKALLESYEAQ